MMGKMTKSEKSSDDDSGREVKASVTESGEIVDEPSGDLVGLSPYETELCNARRALRVAGWSTIFCAFRCARMEPVPDWQLIDGVSVSQT